MNPDMKTLFDQARVARDRAYAPYSRYRVGAAIRTASGAVVTGCNVENAAYPVGTCAEAGAIAAMLTNGERAIAAILVIAEGEEIATPCGACRQRIREFARNDTPVHVANETGLVATHRLDALLPFAFGPDSLGPTMDVPDTLS